MWIHFPLKNQGANLGLDESLLEKMMEFPLNNFHYYCDTLDITAYSSSSSSFFFFQRFLPNVDFHCSLFCYLRPFLSSSTSHSKHFCWNDWLAKPFTQINMRFCIPVLIAGIARQKEVEIQGEKVSVALLTRKANSVTGPKFFACGLEKSGLHAGNEMEADLVLSYVDQRSPQNIRYSNLVSHQKKKIPLHIFSHFNSVKWGSVTWRIGTPPVYLHVTHTNSTTFTSESPADIVSPHMYDQGLIEKYYEGLMKRYRKQRLTIVDLNRGQGGELEATEMVLGFFFRSTFPLPLPHNLGPPHPLLSLLTFSSKALCVIRRGYQIPEYGCRIHEF